MKVVLFKLDDCPRCEVVDYILKDNGIGFKTVNLSDISSPEMIEMRMSGIFPMEAPVLKINDEYYHPNDILDKNNEMRGLVRRKMGILY